MPRCIHALERRQDAARRASYARHQRACDELIGQLPLPGSFTFTTCLPSATPPPRPFLERILDRVSLWPK